MTPRARTNLEILALIIAACMALGGVFVYGSSIVSEQNVTKSRVETIEKRLERMEDKLDLLVEDSRSKRSK